MGDTALATAIHHRLPGLLILGMMALPCLLSSCDQQPSAPVAAKLAPTPAPPEAPITIGYFAPEHYAGQSRIMQGFIDSAEAKGWRVKVANANTDPLTQIRQIKYFIEHESIKVVVAVPVDSAAIGEAIQFARDKGIKFYTIDRAPENARVDMCVMADNELAGRQCGDELVALLTRRYGQPRGTVLELQGDLRQNAARLRGKGFHEAVAQHPEIRVVQRETQWLASRVTAALEDVLSSTTLDAIFMHSDASAMAPVLPVLEQQGLLKPRPAKDHIFLLGIDGSSMMLTSIRTGLADQSSSQPIPDFGILADWIERDLRGEPLHLGRVTEADSLWSPAEVKQTINGPMLLLSTTSVTLANVNDPRLWGNMTGGTTGMEPAGDNSPRKHTTQAEEIQ